ncbi:hypothetical protein Glove_323g29 [Diversispora epigaea]|uniref:Uncharacterized protein n=1 Tax=Diversispora epigaea TaxID=1348612 RepID=A0A397HMZ2_9GLOM|nr:hypothetical protein Glove_323g29 [Diversispora epigaea]
MKVFGTNNLCKYYIYVGGLIIWEKAKNITTNNKRSNKSKFISNNLLAVAEQEVAFDDITGTPLHDSSVMGTLVSRQRYSSNINEALLNARNFGWLVISVQGATMSRAVN